MTATDDPDTRPTDRSSGGPVASLFARPRRPFATAPALCITLAIALAPLPVGAQENSPPTTALAHCAAADAAASPPDIATVAGIGDGLDLRLDDGRTVRPRSLAGPETVAAARPDTALAARARARLTALALGKRIRLIAADQRPDRYGRIAAHLQRVDDGAWIGAALVEDGLAVLDVEPGASSPCRAELSRREADARKVGRNLWAAGGLAVRDASDASLSGAAPSFAIVEGRVLSVGKTRGRIFLNFGRKWRDDFTITIYRRDLKQFLITGFDPEKTKGARVRARGWLQRHDGALIIARWPSQIERLD